VKDSEVISAAQALIDSPSKWMQNAYCDKTSGATPNSFCIEGAIRHTLGILPGHRSAENDERFAQPGEFEKVMRRHDNLMVIISRVAENMFGHSVEMPRDFNDAETTTYDDVMAILDKSRAGLEEQGR
jgi:hypothetical protein